MPKVQGRGRLNADTNEQRTEDQRLPKFCGRLFGVIHKRRPQEWEKGGQAEADTCGHCGDGRSSKSGCPLLVQNLSI